jgi:nicotinamide-nucleotide adenylyltransferase
MKRYKVALFIGRFQPFHNGHVYSLEKAWEMAERVIVGIGSSQESGTESNPWDFEKRKKMIAGVDPRVEIVAIPDMFNDKKWGELIAKIIESTGLTSSEIVGIGNNDWTNRILKQIGVGVYETGLYKRDELEGIKIRKLMKENNDEWRRRLPTAVVKWWEQNEK